MHHTLILSAALFAAAPFATAQQAAPDLTDVYAVAWSDGELRAASRSYVAHFEPGRFTITPVLGRSAPRPFPMQVALQSVRRGAGVVQHCGAAAEPVLRGESVYYDHGSGIVERYDVRALGIKQNVVFASAPAGSGDLVVRYELTTEMACEPAASAATLRFEAAAFGSLTIGEVLAVDAAGQRTRGTMAFDGEALELRLPAAFVDGASYPLELDPLYGPQLNTGVSFDDQVPDIAYDAALDIWGVAFEFPTSGSTSDVWIMRHDGVTGTRLGGSAVGNGPGSQSHPAIASVRQAERFLVVWQDDGTGSGDIKCRGVRPSDGALTAIVPVADTASAELAPDVGGDAFESLDLEALVVWQDTQIGILGAQVQLPAGGTGDPVIVGSAVTLDAMPQSANPAISKSGGMDATNGGRYVVAWEATLGGAPLVGYLGVDRDLNLLAATNYSATGFPVASVDVDGDGSRFLLVFESLEAPGALSSDVWCLPMEFCSGPTGLCGPAAPVAVAVAPNDDARTPCVACCGPMFVVAWADAQIASTPEYRISYSNVEPGSGLLCNLLEQTGPNTGHVSSDPAACAKRAGGLPSSEALLSWTQRQNSTGNSVMKSHRYTPFTGGAVTPVAGVAGCGTGGVVGVNGPFAVGNSEFALTLRQADPLSPAALLAFDTTQAPTTSCGSCTFLTPQLLSPLLPVTNGAADLALPLPCNAALLGFSMDVQWLVLTPVPALPPCGLFPFLSGSDAVRMVLAN